MTACNGINAIIKAMETNNTYLCQPNKFELILTIDNKLIKSPLTWSYKM